MSEYIPFSEEEKDRARHTDLADLLRQRGQTLTRSSHEYEWLDRGQKVTIRNHLWYHQYEQCGGDAIDFVMRFDHLPYTQAVLYLLSGDYGASIAEQSKPPERQLILPPRNDNMRRVFAYLLCRRGIDREVLYTFAQHRMIYESADYHNVVFVGCDGAGHPRHANKRGTGKGSTYKGNAVGSVPEYSFHWNGTDDSIYLFEAPIDMLSYITLHPERWQEHSYAAACSVSDRVLFQCLKDNPVIEHVYICFDNDEPGQAAARRISGKLYTRGISASILAPTRKDWNEALLHLTREEEPCQELQL